MSTATATIMISISVLSLYHTSTHTQCIQNVFKYTAEGNVSLRSRRFTLSYSLYLSPRTSRDQPRPKRLSTTSTPMMPRHGVSSSTAKRIIMRLVLCWNVLFISYISFYTTQSANTNNRAETPTESANTNNRAENRSADSALSSFSIAKVIQGAASAANSATGEVFHGDKIRSFNGPRFDMDAADDILNSFPKVQTLTNKCSRWGVVTTIFDPTEAITRVADMPSWCLVIVADTKTPSNYMQQLQEVYNADRVARYKAADRVVDPVSAGDLDNIFFFSVEKQKEWEQIDGPLGSFVRSTPWTHFCRKNIGYLFAVLHGAGFVFDFDDDHFIKVDADGNPMEILPNAEVKDKMKLYNVSVIMQGQNVLNHHPIMGASVDESWARGFPIELIQDGHTQGQIAFQRHLPFHGGGE